MLDFSAAIVLPVLVLFRRRININFRTMTLCCFIFTFPVFFSLYPTRGRKYGLGSIRSSKRELQSPHTVPFFHTGTTKLRQRTGVLVIKSRARRNDRRNARPPIYQRVTVLSDVAVFSGPTTCWAQPRAPTVHRSKLTFGGCRR